MKTKYTLFNKILHIGLITFLILSCSSDDSGEEIVVPPTYEAGLKLEEMTWENRTRTYQVYFPLERFSQQSLPILFVLHGGGGNATDLQRFTSNRFNQLADTHGFIVVYPEGFEKSWNDGRDAPGIVTAWDENINDVGFISEIANRLITGFNIDKNRIFTSGISNGGFMSSRLLCDRSDLFKGGAIITATLSSTYINSCSASNSNSVLVFNGTDDPLVPYNGGQVTVFGQERGEVISTDAYMQFWANANGCQATPVITDFPDAVDDDTTIQIHDYPSCDNQSVVRLYSIIGGGHTWPGARESLILGGVVGRTTKEIVACDVIWDFFSAL